MGGRRSSSSSYCSDVETVVLLFTDVEGSTRAWASDPGSAGHPDGHGHHGRFAMGRGPGDQPAAFRLPPKIEWMLDTWHTRAHETAATADATAMTADATEATDPKDSGKPTTA